MSGVFSLLIDFDQFLFKIQILNENQQFLRFFKFIFLNCNQLHFCETKNQTKSILSIFIITERILSMFESMLSADVQRHKSEHIQHTFNP
jgi:hypothetical protein